MPLFRRMFRVSFKSPFWRKCRTTLRWCRITLWLVVLLGLCCIIRLNHVGLPDFLKTRLVAALREQGVQLEFSRLRLSLVRGVVADNVRVGDAKNSGNFAFAAREIQLQLNYPALLRRRLHIDGLVVRDGTFMLAASPTNELTLTNLQTELRFQPNDTWTLDHFHADFTGTQILLSGELAHATEIHNWKIFGAQKTITPGTTNKTQFADRGALAQLLEQISGPAASVRLTSVPTVRMTLNGDARDVHSIAAQLDATVPAVRTPWFSARALQLTARVTAPADAPTNEDVSLGIWKNLQPFQIVWTARAVSLHAEKIEADTLALSGEWHAPKFSLGNFSAQIAGGNLNGSAELNVATRTLAFTNASSFDPHWLAAGLTQRARTQLAAILWTQPPTLRVDGSLTLPAWTNDAANWRDEIAPTVKLSGALAFTNAVAGGQTLDFLRTHFSYAQQFWKLSDFELAQGRTQLQFDGDADDATHDFTGHLRGVLAATNARPFLTASNLTQYFDRFRFSEPLTLDVVVSGNWRDWHTLGVTGEAALTNFSVATVATNRLAVDFLRTHFSYANQFWSLSGLELAQGRTRLQFDGETSDATENFTGHLRGAFDPESLRPLLATPDAIRNFEYYQCHEPLMFHVNATGNWRNLSTLTATGGVALTNFIIRAQAFDSVAADFSYTNRWLSFSHPLGLRADGTQMLKADTVALDLVHGRLYVTNGLSTMEPMSVIRCIGPQTAALIEPYQFPGAPMATVNGCAPIHEVHNGHDLDDADLTFVILQPTPFRWKYLHSDAVTATVHWFGQNLAVTNMAGEFSGGRTTGRAFFDMSSDHPGSYFQFAVTLTNVDLHLLVSDLGSPSNTLAGALSGELNVTNANSETWRSWNGDGNAHVRNGQFWNTPLFGLISKALNLLAPSLGNTRATDATMNFGLTNGVVFSDTLEMHTATMRLQYVGTCDLEQNVNARVTALLLRNTPVVGWLASTVLTPFSKFFECQVTGQLGDPKIAPIYVPAPIMDLLFLPRHPVRSVEKIFTLEKNTNAPAQ